MALGVMDEPTKQMLCERATEQRKPACLTGNDPLWRLGGEYRPTVRMEK